MPAVVDEACSQLGIAPTGSLLHRAESCYAAVFGDEDPAIPPSAQHFEGAVVAGMPLDGSAAVRVAVGVRVALPVAGQPLDPRPQPSPADELAVDEDGAALRVQPSAGSAVSSSSPCAASAWHMCANMRRC